MCAIGRENLLPTRNLKNEQGSEMRNPSIENLDLNPPFAYK